MCINMKYGCNILYMHHTRRCAMFSIMSSCWPMDILTSAFFLRRTGSHQNLVNFCIWPKLWKCSGQNFQWPCPLVICYIAMENGHLQLIYPLKMVIFHGYVSLPEGIWMYLMEFCWVYGMVNQPEEASIFFLNSEGLCSDLFKTVCNVWGNHKCLTHARCFVVSVLLGLILWVA